MVHVPIGTQVILNTTDTARPAVGAVATQPDSGTDLYGIRLVDGSFVEAVREAFHIRKESYEQDFVLEGPPADFDRLVEFVILRCVVGSRAYGLAAEESDTDCWPRSKRRLRRADCRRRPAPSRP